jgi:two-component system sensor histidine kinase BarA
MSSPGLSKQIITLAILPALLVGIILSLVYTYDELRYISTTQQRYGEFILKQLRPVTEDAIINDDIDRLKSVLREIVTSEDVSYLRIKDAENNVIITINNIDDDAEAGFLQEFFSSKKDLHFSSPVFHLYDLPDGSQFKEVIANIDAGLNPQRTTLEKIDQVIQSSTLTLIILVISSLIVFNFSRKITIPVKSLIESVRKITAGDLESRVNLQSSGELGILESCINRMREELKASQTDLEAQLDEYTNELQETLEELEIRNAELDITRSKAIYANNAKSEFLANMSHEIRTPLSGIIGFTELLQDTRLSAQQQDYINTIQKSARNLLEIINDILDLSKIESGKTEISTSEFVLVDIIEDIINLLSPTALDKNIELFYRIAEDIDRKITADPFRLHQILTNLIGNAIKFTDKGYVYLQVTQGELENAEHSIKFTVSDTGIGLSNDDKTKLFKAFTQADTSITRRFGGTGLGLVISRKLTMLMHGEIGFDSTHGEGSTFWFTIPVTPVPQQAEIQELQGTKIAFLCNHFIALQSYKTLFMHFGCQVNNYTLDILDNTDEIASDADIVVVFLSRKEINSPKMMDQVAAARFNIPSLLIASTRSHKELRNIQHHIFDNAVFSTEKIERIGQKLKNTLQRKGDDYSYEITDDSTINNHDWSGVNVLIVDDNDVNLRLAEIILHKRKAKVTTAVSGAQAIDYASLNSYDIIFMDLHMPGLDGYQTTQKIREITPARQPVIIALTANALPQEKEKVMQSGMNGILIKPVSDAILQKVISQWVLKGNNLDLNNDTQSLEDKTAITSSVEDDIFSLQEAKEFTGNNEELAYELFTMLRAELPDYREGILAARDNADLDALRHHVHKLHGASRCCGTRQLKETSSHLEALIDNHVEFDINNETELVLQAIQRVADYPLENATTMT